MQAAQAQVEAAQADIQAAEHFHKAHRRAPKFHICAMSHASAVVRFENSISERILPKCVAHSRDQIVV